MIVITATIPTTEDNREEIVALCVAHSVRSRSEPGCIAHHIHADCEDPARLFYYEQWQDEAAVAAHFAVPESRDFVKKLTALVGERPAIDLQRSKPLNISDIG